MSGNEDPPEGFEQRTRAVLEESVTRTDGRVRSRLTQARHAAMAEAQRGARPFWRAATLFPVAGAVAAALMVAIVLWNGRPETGLPVAQSIGDSAQATFEDIELLADSEALELVEHEDGFYEWAAAESESGDGASI